jgi:hypothetical protein
LRHFSTELLKPIPVVIAISVVTTLVDPLKALFLAPSGSFQPRFRLVTPDGRLPLAFVLDTADFIDAASVPIGLICLGSALARLCVRSGDMFPHGAITVLALSRMVVTPLLGVGITRWFVHAGFVARDDKVLQFVCMCVFRPSIDALLFICAFADERFCGQPFLRSAVGYHSGERAFFFQFLSVLGMYSLASVGVPHTNLLAHWFCGTLFGVLDSAVHPDAIHSDWIGHIYAQLPVLRTLDSK